MKRKNPIQTNTSTVSNILSNTATIISNTGSRIYYFFVPSINGAINEATDDILKKVMLYLPLKDLNLQRLVSKRFRAAAEFIFEFCHLPLIPKAFSFNTAHQLASQKVIGFHSECEKITQTYSKIFVQTMTAEKIAILPKKEGNLIEEAMGRNDLVIHLYAKINTPEKTELVSEKIKFFKIVNQPINEKTHVLEKLCIFENVGEILPRGLAASKYDYLYRLTNNHPCGKIVNGVETEPKITDDKQSVVQLCDEKGEVLDFSLNKAALKF